MTPTRIQRKRTKGWTAPLDEQGRKPIYVGRGSRWGNPWHITRHGQEWRVEGPDGVRRYDSWAVARLYAVTHYRAALVGNPGMVETVRAGLAGRTLMCWCPEGSLCHGDDLLTIANQ
ncbi:DUF4326 domain-containing protein [Marinactinospora rubrisoli]|uniref:DUF4326 domain-containing protein n=1 Tax=Marinactinospora rubrisoli TaxID=2715399 RepID=A0ABW2KN42_9ACTN